jgi:predicted lipoprotein with Yx(FWY)xxD motif
MHNRWWAGLALAAAVLVLAACGSKGAPADPATSSPAAAATTQTAAGAGTVSIKTMSTSKGTVLTTAAGLTLYWFAADTATKSNCDGSCTSYWPPVLGTPAAAAGTSLPHGFGTIKRANGQTQATYDGHPLYTYTGDTAAGQINGNGLNASGGLWWAATPSGSDLRSGAAPSPSTSTSGGGSGGW